MITKKTYADVTDAIMDTMAELSGNDVAELHNMVCSNKIRYNEAEDNFDTMDVDMDENCVYCGQKCWEGEMCDEQQAGGFNKEN